MSSDKAQTATSRKDIWHHRGPVAFSPVFDWPAKPLDIFLGMTKRWVTVTRNVLFLLIVICIYNYFLPDLTAMKSLSLDWIIPVLIRNMIIMGVIAGGLHLFFHTWRKQGKKLKFDPKEDFDKTKRYTFGNQLHENIFWSLASGVTVWTAYEVLYYWGVANEVIPVLEFSSSPVAFFAWLLILPLLQSVHFYYVHRMLHWPSLYDRIHRLHHRNIHIGPWAGMSMHPVEHVLYISSVLIHFIIPSHPVIFLQHLFTRCLGPAFSHAGFEKMLINDKVITEMADFHHQLHHKYFDCNYGTVDVPLDKWHNTLHSGSDEDTARVQAERRAMHQKRKAKTA